MIAKKQDKACASVIPDAPDIMMAAPSFISQSVQAAAIHVRQAPLGVLFGDPSAFLHNAAQYEDRLPRAVSRSDLLP